MRNKKLLRTVISILLILSFANCSLAGSIWAKRNNNMRELYSDDVARRIGDILTIKISEDSKTDNKAKRDLKKETDRSAAFNGNLGITTNNNNILPTIPGLTMDASSSAELKGQADYKDERSFVDSIPAVVIDILPNNNLIILGTRSRDIAGDTQFIEISGIVRPSDIAFDNTVKSEQVANFRIVTKNRGISEPYNKPGWLDRIFSIIWPF